MTAHHTEAAVGLYRAILESPWDDFPRLLYADEIEPYEPERAEFIRVQIELANKKHPQGLDRNAPDDLFGNQLRRFHKYGQKSQWGKRHDFLKRREWELINGVTHSWLMWPGCPVMADLLAPRTQPAGSNGKILDRVFRRGFPSSVSLTLAALCGGDECECTRANWEAVHEPTRHEVTEMHFAPRPVRLMGDPRPPSLGCIICHGTGRTTGCAALLSRWPVTAVTISDKEPFEIMFEAPYLWRFFDAGRVGWSGEHIESEIPTNIFANLVGRKKKVTCDFPTRESAITALSRAACDYVRSLAEPPLPGLRWK